MVREKVNIVTKVLILVFLFGCNNPLIPDYWEFNIPETSGKEVFDGDPEPLRPPFWKGQKGLHGIDSDNDGVRDDVEIFINRNQDNPDLRPLYKEYYKAFLNTVETLDNRDSYLKARDIYMHKIDCILIIQVSINENKNFKKNRNFDSSFKSLIQNTYHRNNLYVKAIMTDHRRVFSVPSDEEERKIEKKHCKFSQEIFDKRELFFRGRK